MSIQSISHPDLIVAKFGGTSVGSAERIANVADRIYRFREEQGKSVILVVSAMSGETDRLIQLGREVGGVSIPDREYHQLVVTGEQVSTALVAMALHRRGIAAQSLLAHQLPLLTKEVFGQNIIAQIDAERMRALLAQGITPVVAGFQGIDAVGDFTTLGRGGSDATAVAIAAVLGPCPCYIFTDVDGVYTALPSVCADARKLDYLSYEEMLELASGGAKVLQTRSVSLAHRYRVPLIVCSSFSDAVGTEIKEEYLGMEKSIVSGVTYKLDEAKLTLRNLPDEPGTAARIFQAISEAGIVVDMIVQSEGHSGRAEISFTVPESAAKQSMQIMENLTRTIMPGVLVDLDVDVVKLSVVGEGMRNHAGVAARVFKVLGEEGINLEMITTSEIKVSVVFKRDCADRAMRALHAEFFPAG